MARCPFAVWRPISGSSGPHAGGPFKIVHHTTEGSSAAGAMAAFAQKRSDPHFTVDGTTIFQHVDTAEGARALRNDPGGVQTNRDSAVQIELVGFAHLPKDRKALANVARLCRWIEATHGVPPVWPSGPPKPAKNGKDPGGHNRNAATWDSTSGHYGHCHVPENTHWDPAYSAAEADFILTATFDATGQLTSPALPAPPAAAARRGAAPKAPPRSTMPDHGDVPLGFGAYVRELRLPMMVPPEDLALPAAKRGKRAAPARASRAAAPRTAATGGDASVDVGSVLSFVDGLDAQEKDDVLFSVQLAQRGASGAFDRFTQTRSWYEKYVEILENLGWTTEQMAFTHFDQAEGEFRMDKAALAIISAIATQNQLAVLQQAVAALDQLAENEGTFRLFDFHSSLQGSGNFQLGAVQKTANGAIAMALGSFYFRSADERRRFLFVQWGAQEVNFWSAAQRMTLNTKFYASLREEVEARLADGRSLIGGLKLGAR